MASFKAAGIAFVAISVILLAIIAQDPYYFLNHLGGRTQHADKSRWANFGPVNNDKCWTNSGTPNSPTVEPSPNQTLTAWHSR